MTDFSEKLASSLGGKNAIFYGKGSKHPEYNGLSIADSLIKFTNEVVPASPIVTPDNKPIKLVKTNFPKLAGLKHKTLSKDEFSASDIIDEIEDGTFDPGDYDASRDDRLRTLFWLPELLTDPRAIFRNAHQIVAGDRVFVRVYDKLGSTVKLAFVMDIKKGNQIIKTVPVTSFLTDPETAMSYVRGEPIYVSDE